MWGSLWAGAIKECVVLGDEDDLGKIEDVMGEVCCYDDFGCV